ncbi:MAG: multicopper oxidase domain-containing protein [Thaumarchaeota archaeon]|nr:multicopper oxidase domain-containing protein [Nitrososphaerota archaeon]MCL5318967.1 multicopper oxidase domain-containing protein [Nitrososphaerota archaeon]
MANTTLVIGVLMVAGAALIIIVPAVLILGLQPPMQVFGGAENLKPTVNITLYAKELTGKFGWGLSADNVTSPGPTLRFKVGDVVGITVHNEGVVPHAFAIVSGLDNPKVLFNSQVASPNDPIPPAGTKSGVFKVTEAGNFKYICTVSGHSVLGMSGDVVISK